MDENNMKILTVLVEVKNSVHVRQVKVKLCHVVQIHVCRLL